MKFLALAVSSIFVSGVCLANQAEVESSAAWSVGVGAVHYQSAYRGTAPTELLAPLFSYQGERFSFSGFSVSYRLMDVLGVSVEALLEPGDEVFDASKSHDANLSSLADRDISVMAGIRLSHHSAWGAVTASLTHDISNTSDGYAAVAAYSYPLQFSERMSVVPSIGVRLTDASVANFYYGVGEGESGQLAAYQPGRTTSAFGSISMHYGLSNNLRLNAIFRTVALDQKIKDSPMIDAGYTRVAVVSLDYLF